MKNFATTLLCFCILFLAACNTAPEEYFSQTVLSSNMMVGFAGKSPDRNLEQPSVKMVDGDPNKTVPITRKEMIEDKINFFEKAIDKIKSLKETDDSRELLQATLALNEFVLPVYKNDYLQLAKLYDEGAPQEQITAFSRSIHDKHHAKFETLFNKVTEVGKLYAGRHNIKVNWME
jgi:hypothetical protein